MSTLKGKIADRTAIVKTGFSDFEKAIIKATRHNTKLPKEKHVRRLISYTSNRSRLPELIHNLAKRMDVADWIVVLKTLCVFHRLLRDGSDGFIEELKYKSSIFHMRQFNDYSSAIGQEQSTMIRKYSQYLEEKVLLYKIVGIRFEREGQSVSPSTLPVNEALEKIPRMQSQLNALLNTRGAKDTINNSITIYAFSMLLKDSFPLYKSLNDNIIVLLEEYFTMDKQNALKCIDIYKLFSKETDGLIQFFDMSKRFSRANLPKLQSAPKSLVESLENYIKDLDAGQSGANVKKTQPKQMIQSFSKNMAGFDFTQDFAPQQQDSDSDEDSSADYQKPFGGNGNNFNFFDKDPEPPTRNPVDLLDTNDSNPFSSKPVDTFNPFSNGPVDQPSFNPYPSNQSFNNNQFSQTPQPDYNQKKKQIEMIMQSTQGQIQPSAPPMISNPPQNSSPFAQQPSFNPNQNQFQTQNSFGNPQNNGFQQQQSFNQNPFQSQIQPSFNPQQNQFQAQNSFGNPQNNGFQQQNPNQFNQQQQPFNQNPFQAAPQNQNPFNPFSQAQQQPQQQQQNYNPFM
eukprot:TRINITY_DN2478_c0_g2_i1.p1 TRINITY_DN2478_c0_g2~~TRINITY_DN2478_c0_g2_i1.p1  ORF type:complete len:566 (-),score=233.05 TRINITY_DN2478_c0_g2_i1:197-1894(-)